VLSRPPISMHYRKAAWLLSAVVLFLAASAYVHLLQSRVDERIAFIRSMPVASGAVPVDHGVRGSMFCVSPSCEGVVAYATFRYPDMTTLCRDVERLKTEWPGVSMCHRPVPSAPGSVAARTYCRHRERNNGWTEALCAGVGQTAGWVDTRSGREPSSLIQRPMAPRSAYASYAFGRDGLPRSTPLHPPPGGQGTEPPAGCVRMESDGPPGISEEFAARALYNLHTAGLARHYVMYGLSRERYLSW
jgi:hypothetical protein